MNLPNLSSPVIRTRAGIEVNQASILPQSCFGDCMISGLNVTNLNAACRNVSSLTDFLRCAGEYGLSAAKAAKAPFIAAKCGIQCIF